METIIQRIGKYLIQNKISTRQFEIKIGISNGAISRAFKKGTDIQSKWLSNILSQYGDLNPIWLLTGKGDMIVSESSKFNEDKEEYMKASKKLFERLRNTKLDKDQQTLLQQIETQYNSISNTNASLEKKLDELYSNRDELIKQMKKM